MEIDSLVEKIYLLKSRTIPTGLNLQYHYAKWVSPKINDIRLDKFIDIPFSNITFIAVYVKGDIQNGERVLDMGVAGFPLLIRAPFVSLSPNEFRFPSKNIDQNLRFVAIELLKNCRYLAMSDETFRFLTGKQITCLENATLIQAYIASHFGVIRDKVPFKCGSCKKFLWVEISRIPKQPTNAKCPACAEMLLIEAPRGIDINLARFHTKLRESDGKSGDLLLSSTGEFTPADGLPTKAAGPSIDLELDQILGITTKPVSKTSLPDELLVKAPVPPQMPDLTKTPDAALKTPSSQLSPDSELDDSFFKEILPTSPSDRVKQTLPPPAPLTAGPLPQPEIITDISFIPPEQQQSGSPYSRQCHVCGCQVGSEKICPNCFTEIIPDDIAVKTSDYPKTESLEIRLKDEPVIPISQEQTGFTEGQSFQPEALSSKQSEQTPFWEEKVWSLKIGEEVYENLDIQTVEEWILNRTAVETDLVKKGETRWVELKTVPYFRTAFNQVKRSIQLGSTNASISFSTASLNKRLVAFLFVDFPICLILGALSYFLIKITTGDENYKLWMKVFGFLLFPFLYLSITNGIFGQSIGKRILKIAVINESGKPVGLLKGVLRTLVSFLTCGFGILPAMSGIKKQALHDIAAGTYVIDME